VEMSGQQKIEAASKKTAKCIPRATGKVLRIMTWRKIERVVGGGAGWLWRRGATLNDRREPCVWLKPVVAHASVSRLG
jgi:hypothetical protein